MNAQLGDRSGEIPAVEAPPSAGAASPSGMVKPPPLYGAFATALANRDPVTVELLYSDIDGASARSSA